MNGNKEPLITEKQTFLGLKMPTGLEHTGKVPNQVFIYALLLQGCEHESPLRCRWTQHTGIQWPLFFLQNLSEVWEWLC